MRLNLPLQRAPGESAGLPGVRPRKPWLAALLSFLWPGLGQVYNGRFRRGLVLMGLAAAWQFLGIGAAAEFRWWLGSLAGYTLLSLWAAQDALRAARGLAGFIPGPKNSPQVYLACVALLATVAILAGQVERASYPVYSVNQASMRPTLRSGDRLRSKALGLRDVIRRGQLVVFEHPGERPDERPLIFVKRVVGLPGELVEIADGLVYINGDPIEERYYAFRRAGSKRLDLPSTRLAADEYFVLGDNRHASLDSRSYGPVTRARMLATPLYVIFSLSDQDGVRWDRTGLPAR